ncbi:hypothetical protein B484DRAFT_44478 [Ochromonadaceae sp. CCMP2298]|nr:hypothetical protein B484DRAFT_44478 [Ochromonadaceae sp. CCMP2298]
MEWVELADHWKSFNMEIYDAAAGRRMRHWRTKIVYITPSFYTEMCIEPPLIGPLLKEMAGDFEEAFPVSTFLEVARVLEQSAVHDWIEDAEVALEYAVPPRDLLNANCWAVLNQGMVRKGREKMQAESEVSLSKQWAELLAVSDQFRKGSALLSGGDEVDRFVGFRSRLANKHAWLLGYIGLQQSVVTQQLVDLTNVDPLDKVLHRVRPSQLEQVRRQKEDEFMATQRALEARLEGLQGKLASWNTYFGRGQTSTYYEGYE